jgi:GMP synthase (glutamine-hydrolysing)
MSTTSSDLPVLVIEHETHAGLDLMSAGLGPGVRVIRPYLGDRLPELPERGGLIVLGGSMGAWDDDVAPWLPATRQLIVDAVAARLPTLGICLGAQLVAAACGGTVERGASGLELGVVPVTALLAASADPFFGPIGADGVIGEVSQYHFDAVTKLPADAELMVTADRYPHQGFRVGEAAWAVQYHPEVSTEGFAGWVESGLRAGDLPAAASSSVLAAILAGEQAQRRLASAHARAFLNAVRRESDVEMSPTE